MVIRVKELFFIRSRGIVISIELLTPNAVIHINDNLYDLLGHIFNVIGIDCRKQSTHLMEYQMDLILKGDNIEEYLTQGTLLISDLRKIGFLFCNHPLYQQKVDMDYEEEYMVCQRYFDTLLVSYEELTVDGKLILIGNSDLGVV